MLANSKLPLCPEKSVSANSVVGRNCWEYL